MINRSMFVHNIKMISKDVLKFDYYTNENFIEINEILFMSTNFFTEDKLIFNLIILQTFM